MNLLPIINFVVTLKAFLLCKNGICEIGHLYSVGIFKNILFAFNTQNYSFNSLIGYRMESSS